MKKLLLLLFFLFSFACFSQTKVKDTVTRKARIEIIKKQNQAIFNPQTPPLIQVSGAPPANYSYFWEMGDGSYSKEKAPKKVYKKKGTYKINLSVTNNYDNGKPPTTRPETVSIDEIIDTNFQNIASLKDTVSMELFANRDPIPEQDIVVILSYQNNLNYVANGKLYLFYNDKEFKNKNFDLVETRTHFNEKEVTETAVASVEDYNNSYENVASANDYPSFKNNFLLDDENLDMTLMESKTLFSDTKILEFDGMQPSETRNIFFSFKTTPEMLKDTSATVKMRGVYVPDRSYKTHKKKTYEMEIVTSHDPNKMSSNATLINYRFVKFRTINFKTRFQNNGEGPASTIKLETDIPDMFNKKTLKIVDNYPKCPICPKGENVTYSCLDTIVKKDQIHFVFRNIYLPGSEQKNVKDRDSTKGFVKYSLKFGNDFHKIKTKSKTAIIFDKNEPVITNYATTRFKPGISIGAKAGYNFYTDLEKSKSYFVAATISPYKSYKWYWQVEFQAGSHQYNLNTFVTDRLVGVNGNFQLYRTTTTSSFKAINLEIPVLMRYNVNNFIGLGAGIQANIVASNNEIKTEQIDVYENTTPTFLVSSTNNSSDLTTTFTKPNGGLLFEITGGIARIGPSFGARYVLNFEKDFNYLQLYGIWKF
ncbi:PKD domain-containing protein [Flavobacterium sp.]|uniref:DUF7849 domain-containing protein n=1 Tax=Flavobacterium sp. TaxID=239 RepID=UPI003753CD42